MNATVVTRDEPVVVKKEEAPVIEKKEENLPESVEVKEEGKKETPEQKEEELAPPVPDAKRHDDRRWNRLLRERGEFKAKSEYLESVLNNKEKEAPAEDYSQRPDKAKFAGNPEGYMEALTAYNERLVEQAAQAPVAAKQENAQTSWKAKEAAAIAAHADYEEIVYDSPKLVLPGLAYDALVTSEHGAELRYLLAKEPELSDKISAMPEAAAIRELGRLEARIEAEKIIATKPKPSSTAPKPISPVKGGDALIVDPERETDEQYIARRRQEKIKKFGRL